MIVLSHREREVSISSMLTQSQKTLLSIVKSTLWYTESFPSDTDWDEIEAIAQEQGVLWMLYPGTKNAGVSVPTVYYKKWRNMAHSSVFYNEQKNDFQTELLDWFQENSIPVVILKGISCSRYYPFPNMRPLGDIDILVESENEERVGEYLRSEEFNSSSIPHGFHTSYARDDLIVEVHCRCSELPSCQGTQFVEDEEGKFLSYRQQINVGGVSFPALSDSHQALMLLLHMERHMQEDGIGLRQLCDWATFVAGSDPMHWQETLPLLKECGLFIYAKVITKVCIKHLGLPQEYAAWAANASDDIVDELLQDVFRGGNMGKADDQKAGSLFTSRSTLGTEHQSVARGMFAKMTCLSYNKWPISKRIKALLPFCYLYIAINYVVQSLTNRRSKRNIFVAIENSVKRRKLYQKLHLYEVEQQR